MQFWNDDNSPVTRTKTTTNNKVSQLKSETCSCDPHAGGGGGPHAEEPEKFVWPKHRKYFQCHMHVQVHNQLGILTLYHHNCIASTSMRWQIIILRFSVATANMKVTV